MDTYDAVIGIATTFIALLAVCVWVALNPRPRRHGLPKFDFDRAKSRELEDRGPIR